MMSATAQRIKPWTTERARDALRFHSPSCTNDEWVAVGMALHDEWRGDEAGLDIWDEWSSCGDNYRGRKDCEQRWKTFKAGGGRDMGYIHAVATSNGWKDTSRPDPVDPAVLRREEEERAERKRKFEEKEAKKHAIAAKRAAEIWDKAKPAPENHPYLVKKKIKPHGCRVGPWTVFDPETGQDRVVTENALLVRVSSNRPTDIQTLQAIFPEKDEKLDRDRDYLARGKKAGGFCSIGGETKQHNGRAIFILAEGFATSASVHEATEHRVFACMDAGNLAAVARAIREKKPEALIIIAADHDKDGAGERAAQRAAEAAGGFLSAYTMPKACPADFSDLWTAGLKEQIVEHITDAIERAAEPAPSDASASAPASETQGAGQTQGAARQVAYAERAAGSTLKMDDVNEGGLPGTTRSGTMTGQEGAEAAQGLGIIPLGTRGDAYCFWRKDTETVELIKTKDVASDASILRLADRQAWEMWCCGNSDKGKYDRTAIANMLVQVSKKIGPVDTGLVPASVADADKVNSSLINALLSARPSAGLMAQAMYVDPRWKAAEVWYDVFRSEVMVSKEPPCGGSPGVWSDDYDDLLASWASMEWLIPCTSIMASAAIRALARQDERHPVRDYLNSLQWDGKPRLDTWLIDIAGCVDDDYTRAVGAKTLIGAVARAMSPGCKLDTVLILEGKQGLQKSSLISALVPDLSWHADSLGGDVGTKDAQASLSGKWIIELAELANIRSSEVNKIKQFISDPSDSYRPFYARRTRDFPRQCVFVGTINPEGDGAYLHDATGGRRFWPVSCTKADVQKMKVERDQLWAEALKRFSEGAIWWLTPEEEELAGKEQAERQEDNPWVARVLRYVGHVAPSENNGLWGGPLPEPRAHLILTDIFEAFVGRAYLRRDIAESKAIGSALRALGYVQKNTAVLKGGANVRHWAKRSETSAVPSESPTPSARQQPSRDEDFSEPPV